MCVCASMRACAHVCVRARDVQAFVWCACFCSSGGGLLSAATSCLRCGAPASGFIEGSTLCSQIWTDVDYGNNLRGSLGVCVCACAGVLSLVE